MAENLGRLTRVPVRDVWPHEANHFTPWLAGDENLGLLADTLRLGKLQNQKTEVSVGNFYIDILAEDEDGNIVVIENQFGSTDHGHLGQIMTYLAGQDGHVTVIWIAEIFREEHRATVDWLNANTLPGFSFFAVEVEALRIGESLPAPRFNVVGKPNNWSRSVSRASTSLNNPVLDDRRKKYFEYWSAFKQNLLENSFPLTIPETISTDYGWSFGLSPGFRLVAIAGMRDNIISVQLMISDRVTSKLAFDKLLEDKESIEAAFGGALEWLRLDGQIRSKIAITRNDLDPKIEAQWPDQHAWLLSNLLKFKSIFFDRVRKMNFATSDADEVVR